MAARKLTPKMLEALNAAATAQGATHHLPGFRSATLAALIDRGLLVVTAISGFKITEAGRSELRSVKRAESTAPARFDPEVIDEAHARALTENVTRVGKPEAELIEMIDNYVPSPHTETATSDAEFSACEHGAAPDDCDACFNALADAVDPTAARAERDAGPVADFARSFPHVDAVLTEREEVTALSPATLDRVTGPRVMPPAAPCCSLQTRGIDCGCADAAADRLTGFEPEDDFDDVIECDASVHDGPGPEDGRHCGERAVAYGRCARHQQPESLQEGFDVVTWHQHRLSGDRSGADYLVLGSGIHDGRTVLWLQVDGEGSHRPIPVDVASFTDGCWRALCDHGYHVTDSCPNCDSAEDPWPAVRAAALAHFAPDRLIERAEALSYIAAHPLPGTTIRAEMPSDYPGGRVAFDQDQKRAASLGQTTRLAQQSEVQAYHERLRQSHEESSERLQWTDDYRTEWTESSSLYRHKCGKTFYPTEYRTLGGLVRAMLSHNYLCGR